MWRSVVRPIFIIPILRQYNENDHNMLDRQAPAMPETGMDRVKRMYSLNEYDEVSVELHTVGQSSMFGAFVGCCMGGFMKSRDAYINFIENNQASIFKSTIHAKKRLQDYVTVEFAKGAYRYGWRLCIFTGLFSLISTTVSVYQDTTSLTEYIVAGMITGAMYKANLGLAATMVGAGLGAALSTIGGLAILGLLKVTGVSVDDVRRAMYKIKEAREDQYNQALEKSSTIKNDVLTMHHDILVEEKGVTTIGEIK